MSKTKVFVVSDIHGSCVGARAMVDAVSFHKPEYILCLGDILYHGPRNDLPAEYDPKKVIDIMNAYTSDIIAVRGNCDAEVDQMVLQFPITADYNILKINGKKVFMTHGHVYTPDKHLPLCEGDIFLSGHTHVPTTTRKDGIFYLNPGSVSIPKGGHPATYALFDETGFTVYTLDHQIYMHTDL